MTSSSMLSSLSSSSSSMRLLTDVVVRSSRIRLPPPPMKRWSSSSSSSSSSSASGDGTIVLEKPAKFNPPSHGSRLRTSSLPKHYAPPLSAAEVARRRSRDYPGVMAPEGSWAHWVWHSRLLHTCITMGALFALALATFFLNYTHNSPYKDLVPPLADLWHQPGYFFSAWKNVMILHDRHQAAKAYDRRMANLDDVAKRQYYMKMHGIEPKSLITMVLGSDGDKGVEEKDEEKKIVGGDGDGGVAVDGAEVGEKPLQTKKWFGVW
ncbi:hypothetical protein CDD80_465 [Ophiocordyceps camponoti-rufipedis]|uniref:Uncharacterized protein n=1 Tax=Ophiocordyceps camponoti-rufipedis TaxID=2004952 RepID=A0A2C5XPE9_9HYPO|nr:hypothetical protein CDD80_465 [Ophiocordyceps camponoti-rufipedis]